MSHFVARELQVTTSLKSISRIKMPVVDFSSFQQTILDLLYQTLALIVYFLLVMLTNNKQKIDYFLDDQRDFTCYFQNSRFQTIRAFSRLQLILVDFTSSIGKQYIAFLHILLITNHRQSIHFCNLLDTLKEININ